MKLHIDPPNAFNSLYIKRVQEIFYFMTNYSQSANPNATNSELDAKKIVKNVESSMLMSLHFGRHFWLDDDNNMMSCPTFDDGQPDILNEDYVSEWDDISTTDLDKLFYIHRSLVLDSVNTEVHS